MRFIGAAGAACNAPHNPAAKIKGAAHIHRRRAKETKGKPERSIYE